MSTSSRKRRARGGGTIFFDEKANRWKAQVIDPDTGKAKTRSTRTEAEAVVKLKELHGLTSQGVSIDQSMRFDDWVDNWLSTATLTAKTVKGYRSKLDTYILPALGSKKLARITTNDLDRLYGGMKAKGLAQNSLVQTHAIIRRALTLATRQGLIPRNPAEAIMTSMTPELNPHEQLDAEQAGLVLLEANRGGDLRELVLALCMLVLAMRRHEATALRWEDVDEDAGVILLRHTLTGDTNPRLGARKGSKKNRAHIHELDAVPAACVRHEVHELPLPAMLPEAFRRLRAESVGPWVLPRPDDPGLPMRGEYALAVFKDLCKRAGVPEITLHGGRRSCGSVLLNMGVDVYTISKILDHKDLATTLQHYAKLDSSKRRDALNQLGTLWGDALELAPLEGIKE